MPKKIDVAREMITTLFTFWDQHNGRHGFGVLGEGMPFLQRVKLEQLFHDVVASDEYLSEEAIEKAKAIMFNQK